MDLDRLRRSLSHRHPVRHRPRALDELLTELQTDRESLLASGLVDVHDDVVRLRDLQDVRAAWKRGLQEGFDHGLVEKEEHPVYRRFNERLYGTPDLRYSALDDTQIRRMVHLSGLGENGRFLDIGCATGTLTALVADWTNSVGHGIDYAPSAIERARRVHGGDRLHFSVADLDALAPFTAEPFQAILAFEVLYFPTDLTATLEQLASLLAPEGRLVASYTHRSSAGKVPADPATSPVGRALEQAGWEWVALDATAEGRRFWERCRSILADMESTFREHDATRLWQGRVDEADTLLTAFDEASARAYLFVATPR